MKGLGYSWPGTLPCDYKCLLPRSCWCCIGLWFIKTENFWECGTLAFGSTWTCRVLHCHHACWKQMWFKTPASSSCGRCQEICQWRRTVIHWGISFGCYKCRRSLYTNNYKSSWSAIGKNKKRTWHARTELWNFRRKRKGGRSKWSLTSRRKKLLCSFLRMWTLVTKFWGITEMSGFFFVSKLAIDFNIKQQFRWS